VHPQQPPRSVQARSGPRPQAFIIAFTRCGFAPPPAGKCPFARISSQPRAAGANTTHRRVKLYAWPCSTLPLSSWLAITRICAAGTLPQRNTVGAIAQQVRGERTRRACKLLTECTGNIVHPAAATRTAVLACHRTSLRSCAVASISHSSISCSSHASSGNCNRCAASSPQRYPAHNFNAPRRHSSNIQSCAQQPGALHT
jgi:hypothetical protein